MTSASDPKQTERRRQVRPNCGLPMIGEVNTVADHVCFLLYRVKCRSVSDLNGVVNFDAAAPNGAFDLLNAEQELDGAKVAGGVDVMSEFF